MAWDLHLVDQIPGELNKICRLAQILGNTITSWLSVCLGFHWTSSVSLVCLFQRLCQPYFISPAVSCIFLPLCFFPFYSSPWLKRATVTTALFSHKKKTERWQCIHKNNRTIVKKEDLSRRNKKAVLFTVLSFTLPNMDTSKATLNILVYMLKYYKLLRGK